MADAAPWWARAYRLVFGGLIIVAIVAQLVDEIDDGRSVGNMFSFFTIQSNLVAAAVLLWGATRDPERRDAGTVDVVRGAAALYMTITGIVYGLLLSGYTGDLQTSIPWVNTALHRVIPIVMFVDWLLVPPRTKLTVRRGIVWLAFPALYGLYTWLRGPIVDWYPYPFMNPTLAGGWAAVAAYSVGIAVGALGFVWLMVRAGNRLRLITMPEA